MGIIINGVKVTMEQIRKHTQAPNGYSTLSDNTYELIEAAYYQREVHRFRSYNEMIQAFSCTHNYLSDARKQYYMHNGQDKVIVKIIMTGNYTDDFIQAANEAVKKYPGMAQYFDSRGRIDGYIWHHREKIKKNGTCVMELITKQSHDIPHQGGVKEYRESFGEQYYSH